jgi:PAS domain S-box-containing protein
MTPSSPGRITPLVLVLLVGVAVLLGLWIYTVWHETVEMGGFTSHAVVPISGVALTVLLGVIAYTLLLQMGTYREGRDRALREVEERRRAEEALRVAEKRYHDVFDSTADAMLVFDPAGILLEANPAAAVMHGYTLDELVGLDVRELIAPRNRHQFEAFIQALEEQGTVSLESYDVRRDGTPFPIEVRGNRFFHEDEQAVLAIVRDVTERQLAVKRQDQLSRKILVAQEEERARVSRDLHDGLGQQLTALRLELDWLHKRTPTADDAAFDEATGMIDGAVGELRGICRGLRPPLLDDLGLEPAALQLVQEFEEHTKLEVTLELHLGDDLPEIPSEVALCIYRVLQEGLTNVHRHAHASRVEVLLQHRGEHLELALTDDGSGFGIERIPDSPGFGITGMEERAKLVNGVFSMQSREGDGTKLELQVPVGPRVELEET